MPFSGFWAEMRLLLLLLQPPFLPPCLPSPLFSSLFLSPLLPPLSPTTLCLNSARFIRVLLHPWCPDYSKSHSFRLETLCLIQGIWNYSRATILLLPSTPHWLQLTHNSILSPVSSKQEHWLLLWLRSFFFRVIVQFASFCNSKLHFSLESKLCKNHVFIEEARTEMKWSIKRFPQLTDKRSTVLEKKNCCWYHWYI